MSTEVSPTQKQQQLFAEMQSVRRMLLLQDPHFWQTEPYFWAHGAHLVPTIERSRYRQFSWTQGGSGPSGPELANIIVTQASHAMQQQQQQHQHQQGKGGRCMGRHREQLQQAAKAAFNLHSWDNQQVSMEMKNLIKIWRKLKMKKHKIRKRQKANRYKNT